MKKPQTLTRTCLTCGLDKPLAAFLQLSGEQGTTYGNICATCRSVHARSKNLPATEDDNGKGGFGFRIDAKAKIQKELAERKFKKELDETFLQEKNQDEKLTLEKTEKKELKIKSEKNHRNYLEAKKKQGFLTNRIKIESGETLSPQEKLAAANLEENQLKNVDFTHIDFQTEKAKSVNFKYLESWLGESANFRTMKRLASAKKETKNQNNEKPAENVSEYLKKTFKPSR